MSLCVGEAGRDKIGRKNKTLMQNVNLYLLNVLKSVSRCLVSNFLRAGVLNFVKLL